MSGYDWNEVATLLHIVEKTKDMPTLKKLFDSALADLHAIAAKDPEADPAYMHEVVEPNDPVDITETEAPTENGLKRRI